MNPLERVVRYRTESQKPAVSERKNIDRIEKRRSHILRADRGSEIGFVLVSPVNAGVKGKPAREVMRQGHSDISRSLVLARQIEILAEASDTDHKKLCPFPRMSVNEDDVFSCDDRTLAAGAQVNVVVVAHV